MRSRAASFELAPADPLSADAQYCLGQYFEELDARFRGGFDRLHDAAADATDLAPPAGCLIIARLSGQAVGCAGLRALEPDVGEIKRMWVARAARGMGLGRSLLRELEEVARRRGWRTLRLDTNESLSEALKLYRSSGYREISRFNDNPYAHHWFEKLLT